MKIEADIDELIQLVSNVTESYTTAFFLADSRRQVLKLWQFYSLGNNVIEGATIPFGQGPIGRVAESEKPFDLSKFSDRDSGLLKLYSKNEDIKSFFAVPVMTDGVLAGVLCIDSKKAFVFANKDQKLLGLFAKQFANLINNIKIQKFVDTEASDIAFLHSFCSQITSISDIGSILDLSAEAITQLVECDGNFLCLRIDDGLRREKIFRVEESHSHKNMKGLRFSDQDGLAGCIIRGRESFLLSNRKRELGSYVFTPAEAVGHVTSFLGVPLLTEDDVLGAMCLVDSAEDSFNQRDLRVASIVAGNAALSIGNLKVQKKLQALSTTVDGLTGLYNFSGFHEHLGIAFQEASQKRRPLSLVFMNIDNLMELNDNSGYEIGNEILKRFSQILIDLSRNEGIIAARYSSGKFALILPNTQKERASLIGEMIREAVADPTFIVPSHGIRTFVSIGLATFPQDGRSRSDLIGSALQNLSIAKSSNGKTN